jgi:hypothetical protein
MRASKRKLAVEIRTENLGVERTQVEQQGGPEEFGRPEALMALAILSIHAPGFLNEVRTNLESTLWRYGFALSPQEMRQASYYFAERATLSDRDIVAGLREQIESGSEQIGSEAFFRWFRP